MFVGRLTPGRSPEIFLTLSSVAPMAAAGEVSH